MYKCRFKAYEGDNNYIFISYAHKDSDQVYPIVERLNEEGYRVWFDDGIAAGTEWPEYIATHLDKCAVFLSFISTNFIVSENCKREFTFAQAKKKLAFGIFLEETEMTLGMEMQMSTQQNIMKYEYENENAFYDKLLSTPIIDPCMRMAWEEPPEMTDDAYFEAAEKAANFEEWQKMKGRRAKLQMQEEENQKDQIRVMEEIQNMTDVKKQEEDIPPELVRFSPASSEDLFGAKPAGNMGPNVAAGGGIKAPNGVNNGGPTMGPSINLPDANVPGSVPGGVNMGTNNGMPNVAPAPSYNGMPGAAPKPNSPAANANNPNRTNIPKNNGAVPPASYPQAKPPKKKKGKKGLIVVLVIIGLIILCCGGGILFALFSGLIPQTYQVGGRTVTSTDSHCYVYDATIDGKAIKSLKKCKKIDTFSFSNCTFTSDADLGELGYLENVTWIKMENCSGISDYSFLGKLTKVSYLSITNAPALTDISMLPVDELYSLEIQGCGVSDISVLADAKRMNTLNISGNPISKLPEFDSNCWLREINAADCGLKNVDSLANLTNLSVVNLSYNEITEVKFLESGEDNYTVIRIGHNKLDADVIDIIADCDNVTELDVSGIPIDDLSAVDKKALEILYMEDCGLTSLDNIDFTTFTALEELNIGHNKFGDKLDLCGKLPAGMAALDVSGNGLKTFTFDVAGMEYLDISDNQLTSIPDIATWSCYPQGCLFMQNNPIDYSVPGTDLCLGEPYYIGVTISGNISTYAFAPFDNRVLVVDSNLSMEQAKQSISFGITGGTYGNVYPVTTKQLESCSHRVNLSKMQQEIQARLQNN